MSIFAFWLAVLAIIVSLQAFATARDAKKGSEAHRRIADHLEAQLVELRRQIVAQGQPEPENNLFRASVLPEKGTKIPIEPDQGSGSEIKRHSVPGSAIGSQENETSELRDDSEAASIVSKEHTKRPVSPSVPSTLITVGSTSQMESKSKVHDVQFTHPAARAKTTRSRLTENLETQIATRLPVWLGAIAIGLAGVFLANYAIDQGWLGPVARVLILILGGAGLVSAAEALRTRLPKVPAGMAAAGIVLLYVAFYAAGARYLLIGPALNFLAFALVTGLAVFLSLRHGEVVAIIGLLGGYVTPLLVGDSEITSAGTLFTYLLLLQLGLSLVSERRAWHGIASAAYAGGMIWIFLTSTGDMVHSPLRGVFVLFALANILLYCLRNAAQSKDGDGSGQSALQRSLQRPWLANAAGAGLTIAAASLQLGMVMIQRGFRLLDWALLAILLLGVIFLGWLKARWLNLVWIPLLVPAPLMLTWVGLADVSPNLRDFVLTGLIFGAMSSTLTFLASIKALPGSHTGETKKNSAAWSAMSALASVVYFISIRAGIWLLDADLHARLTWELVLAGLAILFLALAAWHVTIERSAEPSEDSRASASSPLLIAMSIFALWAGADAFDDYLLTIAWLGLAALLFELSSRWNSRTSLVLASLLSILTSARLLINPIVTDYHESLRPVLNWTTPSYGLAIAVLLFGALKIARHKSMETDTERSAFELPKSAVFLGLLALLHALWYLAMQVRIGFVGTLAFGKGAPVYLEWAAYAIAWQLLAIFLHLSARRRPWSLNLKPLERTASILTLIAGALGVYGTSVLSHPLDAPLIFEELPLLNGILLGHGLIAGLSLLHFALRLRSSETEPEISTRDDQGASASALNQWIILLSAVQVFAFLYFSNSHFFNQILRAHRALGVEEIGMLATWLSLAAYAFIILEKRMNGDVNYSVLPSRGLYGMGILILFVSLLVANPIQLEAQGLLNFAEWPIVNGLILAFGLPAGALYFLTSRTEGAPIRSYVRAAALIAFFFLISFEVRHWFHGSQLAGGLLSVAERYSYSLAWLIFGIVLMILGIRSKDGFLRRASLLMMGITAAKVFVLDTAGLDGLYRVFSFLGLGLSLLGLASIYQHFVVEDSEQDQTGPDDPIQAHSGPELGDDEASNALDERV